MENNYTTPLARWARALETFIPGYMFGKSYGIADEKTVDLFRAQFPAFLINLAEFLKGILHTDNTNLQRFITNTAGAAIGFILIAFLAIIMHLVLRDRKYLDTLRFTAVTILPIAVLNGTLSHAVKTLVENMGTQTVDALTKSAVEGPRNYLILNFCFYMICLWIPPWRSIRCPTVGSLPIGGVPLQRDVWGACVEPPAAPCVYATVFMTGST